MYTSPIGNASILIYSASKTTHTKYLHFLSMWRVKPTCTQKDGTFIIYTPLDMIVNGGNKNAHQVIRFEWNWIMSSDTATDDTQIEFDWKRRGPHARTLSQRT